MRKEYKTWEEYELTMRPQPKVKEIRQKRIKVKEVKLTKLGMFIRFVKRLFKMSKKTTQ